MRKIFSTFLFFALVLFSQAQNDTVTTSEDRFIERVFPKIPDSLSASIRKNTLSLRLGYSPFFGIQYESAITPRVGLDFFAGLFGAGVGTNFYFPGLHKTFGFKTGIQGSYNGIPFVGNGVVLYVPVGFYVAHKGFFMSLDAGPQTDPFYYYGYLGISLHLGTRF